MTSFSEPPERMGRRDCSRQVASLIRHAKGAEVPAENARAGPESESDELGLQEVKRFLRNFAAGIRATKEGRME